MINFCVFHIESGQIVSVISGMDLGQVRLLCEDKFDAIELQLMDGEKADDYYVKNYELRRRPDRIALPETAIVPLSINLSGVDHVENFTVRNEAGDSMTITDWSSPLVLIDAGFYDIEVEAAFPAHSFRQTIEVKNA